MPVPARFAAPALTTGWNPASSASVGGGHRSGTGAPSASAGRHAQPAVGSGLIDLGYGELYRNVATRPRHGFRGAPGLLSGRCWRVSARYHAAVSCWLPAHLTSLLSRAFPGWILFVEQHAWSRKPYQASVLPIEFRPGKVFRLDASACARAWSGVADGMVRAAFLSSNEPEHPLVFAVAPSAGAGRAHHGHRVRAPPCSRSEVRATRTIYKAAMLRHGLLLHAPARIHQRDKTWKACWPWQATAPSTCSSGCFWRRSRSNYRLSSTEVFGIGWGMVTLGVLLGSIAGNIVDRFAPFTPQFLSLIALIATMAVLLSFLFVFRESDLIALTEEPESEAENAEDRALGSSSDAPPTASDSPRPRFQDPLPGSGRRLRAVAQGDRGDDPLRQGPLGRPHSRGAVHLEGDP